MKLINIQEKLQEKGPPVFSVREFAGYAGVSGTASQKLLERYSKKGFFVRLKKGLYSVKSRQPHAFVVSNSLYRPSYISFESALSFHGLIPETVYEVSAATPKASRNFSAGGRAYSYHRIKGASYCGYEPAGMQGGVVYIASPEKALVDYLYMVSLGRKALYERLDARKVNRRKALKYASLYGRKSLMDLVDRVLSIGEVQE